MEREDRNTLNFSTRRSDGTKYKNIVNFYPRDVPMEPNIRRPFISTGKMFRCNGKGIIFFEFSTRRLDGTKYKNTVHFLPTKRSDGTKGKSTVHFYSREVPMERNTRTPPQFLPTRRSEGTKGKNTVHFYPRDIPMERKARTRLISAREVPMERNTRASSISTHETFRWNEIQEHCQFLPTRRSDGRKARRPFIFLPRKCFDVAGRQYMFLNFSTRRSDGTKYKNTPSISTHETFRWNEIQEQRQFLPTRRSDGTKYRKTVHFPTKHSWGTKRQEHDLNFSSFENRGTF
jgi:hypothetical protein